MYRWVSAHLELAVDRAAKLAIQIGVADPLVLEARETTTMVQDDAVVWSEHSAPHGGRIWLLDVAAGKLTINYEAELSGVVPAQSITDSDRWLYLRPSRYCESDRLADFAARRFKDLDEPLDVLAAVASWVSKQLEYVSGSSEPTDGAVDTLLAAKGVCRDYAHLAVALLRALEIPARLVAVYAPGLDPMDFHAVAEALVEGEWYVVDATLLAPRGSLVRIATGRDAADTSFLSSTGGAVTLESMSVTATIGNGELPRDDGTRLVQLG